jgi:hypothetical protein
MTVQAYLDLENDPKRSEDPRLVKVKVEIPYQLSEAEPTNTGAN